MISQAQSLYPTLVNMNWYGANGIAGDQSVITNPALDAKIKLISASFQPVNSTKFITFYDKVRQQVGGTFPAFESAVYDETWLAALSILACGSYNGTCVYHVLPTIANNYYGVIGWTNLNSFGDLATGDFGIWEIANVNGATQWVYIGEYSSATGQITYTPTP